VEALKREMVQESALAKKNPQKQNSVATPLDLSATLYIEKKKAALVKEAASLV
jgi:hypothetical protein